MDSKNLYAQDLEGVLDLEEIDRNLYRGLNAASAVDRTTLYGGQVAAQALMAAGLTVESDRRPHSLHGYFLRPGQVDRPVILRVDIDRDGGSFSARHVAAMQDGAVIFSMLASFHRADPVDVLDEMPPSDVPPPEACKRSPVDRHDPLLASREVSPSAEIDGHYLYPDCMWQRVVTRLPDDPLIHACGLVYLSDYGSGFAQRTLESGNSGPSLDHAVWFHTPTRADEWVLLHMWPRKATDIRGLYDGAMRDTSGRLAAVIAQEHLLLG